MAITFESTTVLNLIVFMVTVVILSLCFFSHLTYKDYAAGGYTIPLFMLLVFFGWNVLSPMSPDVRSYFDSSFILALVLDIGLWRIAFILRERQKGKKP